MYELQKVEHINGKIKVPKKCKVDYYHKSRPFRLRFDMEKMSKKVLRDVVEFSYKQAIEERQRPHFENSEYIRTTIEMFLDTCSGKIGESCFQRWMEFCFGIDVEVNLESWERGHYETVDFVVNGKKFEIKTIKEFANLLMWIHAQNSTKVYSEVDGMFLCRTNVITQLTRVGRKSIIGEFYPYFEKKSEYFVDKVVDILTRKRFNAEVAGYADKKMILKAIERPEILKKGEVLGKKPMKADNDYIALADLLTSFNV